MGKTKITQPISHKQLKRWSPSLSRIATFALLATAIGIKTCPAQTPSSATPSFDAASIRPSNQCTGFSMSSPGARLFSVTNASMAFLIGMAYKVGDDQIVKNPAWIESECYTITARADGDGNLGNDQLRLLLQHLLSQRFDLAVHREVQQMSGYALVITKDGPKLKVSASAAGAGHIGPEGMHAQNISTGALVSMLTRAVSAHVVDETGLTGKYDIDLSFQSNMSPATDSSLPSIFTAFEEQLGLKLMPRRVPVSMLVIDHVDKIPTEN